MGRFRIVDDDDDGSAGWQFVAQGEKESSSLVPFVQEDEGPLEEESTVASTMIRNEQDPHRPVVYYVPANHYENEVRRSPCNLFRLSVFIGLFGILCHAYLPPAPPPTNTSHHDDDEVLSWNAYLQSHSQQLLQSAKALAIDTPFHILSWLGTAAFKDLQQMSALTHSTIDCAWAIPPSVEAIHDDFANHITGQDVAVSLASEALVAWAHHEDDQPLKILAVGPKSTGKRTLAKRIDSFTSCESTMLYIPKDDPRSLWQITHRIQQHLHQYPSASVIVYHDERLDDIPLENASNAVLYRVSETAGRSIMAHALRTDSWGSASMMADLRSELSHLMILPFAPMTPSILEEILRRHAVDHHDLLETVEYMDWTTKDGALILRVAIEGAQSLPWNKIRARQAAIAAKEESNHEY